MANSSQSTTTYNAPLATTGQLRKIQKMIQTYLGQLDLDSSGTDLETIKQKNQLRQLLFENGISFDESFLDNPTYISQYLSPQINSLISESLTDSDLHQPEPANVDTALVPELPPIPEIVKQGQENKNYRVQKYLDHQRAYLDQLEKLSPLADSLTELTIENLIQQAGLQGTQAKILRDHYDEVRQIVWAAMLAHPHKDINSITQDIITLSSLGQDDYLRYLTNLAANSSSPQQVTDTLLNDITVGLRENSQAQQLVDEVISSPGTTSHLVQSLEAVSQSTLTPNQVISNIRSSLEKGEDPTPYIAQLASFDTSSPELVQDIYNHIKKNPRPSRELNNLLTSVVQTIHYDPLDEIINLKVAPQLNLTPNQADALSDLKTITKLSFFTHPLATNPKIAQENIQDIGKLLNLSPEQIHTLSTNQYFQAALITMSTKVRQNPESLLDHASSFSTEPHAIAQLQAAMGPNASHLNPSQVRSMAFFTTRLNSNLSHPDQTLEDFYEFITTEGVSIDRVLEFSLNPDAQIEVIAQRHQLTQATHKPPTPHTQPLHKDSGRQKSQTTSQSPQQSLNLLRQLRQYTSQTPKVPESLRIRIFRFLRHPLSSFKDLFGFGSPTTNISSGAASESSSLLTNLPRFGTSISSGVNRIGSGFGNILQSLKSAGSRLFGDAGGIGGLASKGAGLASSAGSAASAAAPAAAATFTAALPWIIAGAVAAVIILSIVLSFRNSAQVIPLGESDQLAGGGSYSSEHCFNFIDFPPDLLSKMEQAGDTIADQGCYIDALCEATNYNIDVIYKPDESTRCGGWAPATKEINIYPPENCGSGFSELYTLAHESGHIFIYNTSEPETEWKKLGLHQSDNTCLPSYPTYHTVNPINQIREFDRAKAARCESGDSEDMPETIADYIYGPFSSKYDIVKNYPNHLKWANSIFQCSGQQKDSLKYFLAVGSTDPSNVVTSTSSEANTPTPTCTWATNNSSGQTLAASVNANFFTKNVATPIGHLGYSGSVAYFPGEMRSDFASFVSQNGALKTIDTPDIGSNTSGLDFGVSGIPRLVFNNQTTNHHLGDVRRRTAIGFNDSNIFLVSTEPTSGAALTDLLIKLGAKEAINLDGGTSTTFCKGDTLMFGNNTPVPASIGLKVAAFSDDVTTPPPPIDTCSVPTLVEESSDVKLFHTSSPRSESVIISEIEAGLNKEFSKESDRNQTPVHVYLLESCQPGNYGKMYDYMQSRGIAGMTIEDNKNFKGDFDHCLPNCIFFRRDRASNNLTNLTWHESKHMIQAHNNPNFDKMYWSNGADSTETSYAAFTEAWADEGPGVGGPNNTCQDYFPKRLDVLKSLIDPRVVNRAGKGFADSYQQVVDLYQQDTGEKFSDLFPEKLGYSQHETIPAECQ